MVIQICTDRVVNFLPSPLPWRSIAPNIGLYVLCSTIRGQNKLIVHMIAINPGCVLSYKWWISQAISLRI